jgi:hypothetical protein
MNNAQLAKRVNDLAEKLKPVPSEGIRIDFDSFTEPEKYVLLKNRELDDKYGNRIPDEIFEENKDLIFKANDIALKRTSELFEFIVPRALMLDKVEQWFFNLHFRIFWKNLKECLENVRKWSKDEKEEFLSEDWGRFEFKKEKDG